MTRSEAIEEVFREDEDFTLYVHRDYPGNHDSESADCWCRPFAVHSDDRRTPEEVLRDVEAAEAAEAIH